MGGVTAGTEIAVWRVVGVEVDVALVAGVGKLEGGRGVGDDGEVVELRLVHDVIAIEGRVVGVFGGDLLGGLPPVHLIAVVALPEGHVEVVVKDPCDHTGVVDEVEFLAGVGEAGDGDAAFGHGVEDLLGEGTGRMRLVHSPGADWKPIGVPRTGPFGGA